MRRESIGVLAALLEHVAQHERVGVATRRQIAAVARG